MKKKFKVHGAYTISFDMEIIAESKYEALDIAYNNAENSISTEWNGNSVFVDACYDDEIEEFTLCADGLPSDVEIIDETEYEEDEDDE